MASKQALSRYGPLIPSAPFAAWVRGELEKLDAEDEFGDGGTSSKVPSLETFAARISVTEKTVRRYRDALDGDGHPTDVYHRYPVEDALHRADVPFADVYPELALDIGIEPDIWCESCDSMVTPIRGLCPWCTPEPGHSCSCPGCGAWKDSRAKACRSCREKARRAA